MRSVTKELDVHAFDGEARAQSRLVRWSRTWVGPVSVGQHTADQAARFLHDAGVHFLVSTLRDKSSLSLSTFLRCRTVQMCATCYHCSTYPEFPAGPQFQEGHAFPEPF
jgi:hypothetical protein